MPRDPFANRVTPGSPWSEAELADLRDLLRDGYGIIDAIRLFRRHRPDRSWLAVRSQASVMLGYYGGKRTVEPAAVRARPQNEVAALMGVDAATVQCWEARGWLPTTRTRARKQAGHGWPRVYIHDTDLHALLEHREAWPAFDPARITDPDLREAALEVRREAGGHWERVADVVAALGYAPAASYRFIRTCPLPLTLTTWKRTNYIWSADVPALAAWIRHPKPRPVKRLENRYATD
jgi:hypothetical protein